MSYKIYEVRVYSSGRYEWRLDGKLHREDGPAIECANGTKYWCLNGKFHREDGPALEYVEGTKYWYLNGKQLSQKEFEERTKSCDGKVVEIDGRKYKLSLVSEEEGK